MLPEHPERPYSAYKIIATNSSGEEMRFLAESKEGLDGFELQQVKNVVIGYLVNDEFRKKWRNDEQT